MSAIQRTISFSVVFLAYFSGVSSVSSIDIQLNRTYREFGFSRTEVKVFSGYLNRLIKQLFGFERLKYRGLPVESLCSIIKAGMLIELSEHGQVCIEQAAQEFANNVNARKFPLSDKATRLLRADVKKFAFSWIIDRLEKYEKLSFYKAYVMHYDAPSVVLELADESSDFKVDVIALDELSDEFGWLGI